MRFTPLALLIFSFQLTAQIQFEKPDWQHSIEKARTEKKLLMVYMNTEWCEPCLEMELGVFQDQEIGNLYSKFVNVPFDAELYPGIEIADRYKVDIFPTFLFLNEYGEVVHRGCGFMEKEGFQLMANDAMGQESLMAVRTKFETGDHSVDVILSYTELLESACMDKTPFIHSYFRNLPHDQWVTPATWAMINLNVSDPNSQEFEFLTTYRDRFALQFGKDTIDKKIYNVLLDQYVQIYEGADLTLFAIQSMRKMLNPLEFSGKERLQYMLDLEYFELVENWEEFAKSAQNVVTDQQITDEFLLNEFAWKFYLHVVNPELLNVALSWMAGYVEQTQNASTLDTYASLLYKTGDPKGAQKWEKKAIEQAKSDMEDLLPYQLQLDKFERKQD